MHNDYVLTGDKGADAQEFCEAEELALNSPTVNNLGGSAPGPKVIRFPSVKAGVDLLLSASDDYTPRDAGKNGLKNGFGNINMKTGTSADLTFTFVAAGTDDPVVVPAASLTFYDMDEGKNGKSRGTVESCGVAQSFIPASTELAQQFQGDCVKTSTCKRGKKGNDPPNAVGLNDDHLKRAMTLSYKGKSSFSVRMAIGKGHKKSGRNFMFALAAVGACRLTTTTTTEPIPTTQPVPHCPAPTGPYRFCNCHGDPACDSYFLEGKKWYPHHGFGVFWAAKAKNGDGVQIFQIPYHVSMPKIANIGGIAVKMGGEIITYTASDWEPWEGENWKGLGVPKVKINDDEYKADTVSVKTKAGYVVNIPADKDNADFKHTQMFNFNKNDGNGICIGDDAHTFQVSIFQRLAHPPVEFGWRINMADSVMDQTKNGKGYGQICMDGPTYDAPNGDVVNGQRVPYNASWFSWQDLDDLCSKTMGRAGGCSEAEDQVDVKPVKTNEDLCAALNIPWADAEAACSGITKPAFLNACTFEYCNDQGQGNPKEVAEQIEKEVEAAQANADESHANELDFVPDECCFDDPDCSKDFGR